MMNGFKIIDLTHPIQHDLPVWPGDPPTCIVPATTIPQIGYALNRLTIGEHSGTHVGAPCHLIPDAADMASIPAANLILPTMKIDVRGQAASAARFLVSPDQLQQWEKDHGKVAAGSAILIETGWSVHWHDAGRYFAENFPGLERETVDLLMIRGVKAVGIDSPGIDGGGSCDFAANRALARNGALHLENLANLDRVPLKGAWIFIGALPIIGGSGSPARILALMPAQDS
jgi:kynurenine formamidase